MALSDLVRTSLQRVSTPVVDFLIRRGVTPNQITTAGTVGTVVGGGLYAAGQIQLAGWVVGVSAIADLLDGDVARRSGQTSVFGAFYDSTLDRIADGAVLGGLMIFFARNAVHNAIPFWMSTPMQSVLILGIIGSFLTSYTRARAEGLGIDARVGILQRPERIFLLSAPQAFFGLAFGGWVLMAICVLLTVTAWITVVQRIAHVYRSTRADREQARAMAASRPPAASAPERSLPDEAAVAAEVEVSRNAQAPRLADASPAEELAAPRSTIADSTFDHTR
jgi:CDP-diacylglycerol--glycerol-3-phosphate 3-phosphatidyltransferase